MSRLTPPPAHLIAADVLQALNEDIGPGDVTAQLLPAQAHSEAIIVCREKAVLAGAPWAEACFRQLDPDMSIDWQVADGETVTAGSEVCRLRGSSRAIVSAERTALNFLQTLSATATATAAYVAAVAGTRATVLDTRKTLPGLRHAQKYAVRAGGGSNHRIGLFDALLIKENHIAAFGSIAAVAARARELHPELPLIVEVESLDELDQAIAAQVDRVLLDDFDLPALHAAVARAAGRVPLEVSGGVDLTRVRQIAETGVDFISIGALTKNIRAVDLSLRVVDV